MANHTQYSLDLLEFGEHHVKNALHCLLHTIFFNRALGMVQPREVDADGRLDVYWVECNDPQVEETVRRRVDEFAGWLAHAFQAAPNQPQRAVVTVQFYESKRVKHLFSETVEKNLWEEWNIHLKISPTGRPAGGDDVEERRQVERLSQELRDRMRIILEKVDEKKDHLPQVRQVGGGTASGVATSSAGEVLGMTYNYCIVLPMSDGSDKTAGGGFMKGLGGMFGATGNPLNLLG